jgi:hypothetical protein
MIEWTDTDNPHDDVRSRVFVGDRVACLITKHDESVYTVRAGKLTESASSLCLAKHIGEAMLEHPH